jgi:hypothetical protein
MFQICSRCHVQVVDGICRCTDPELFRPSKPQPTPPKLAKVIPPRKGN